MVSRRRRGGYTIAVLVVFLTVLSVALAVVLPKWSTAIRREQEEELIFRGLQYAEGIRVFQKRFGRYPASLDELLETKPRCIRQPWKEPVSPDGKWRPIRVGEPGAAGAGPAAPGAGAGDRPPEVDPSEEGDAAAPSEEASAEAQTPIFGVRSRSKNASILTFMGQTRYSDWRFTSNLVVPGGAPLPGSPEAAFGIPGMVLGAGGPGGAKIPNANWIGRPLPGAPTSPGQLPSSPGMPGTPDPGKGAQNPEGDDGE